MCAKNIGDFDYRQSRRYWNKNANKFIMRVCTVADCPWRVRG